MIKVIRDASHAQAKGAAIHLQLRFTHLLIGRSKRRWFALKLFRLSPHHQPIQIEIRGHRPLSHLKYLKYVLRHKCFVFQECLCYGLIWQGVVHDLSKFLPSEWMPYVQYFHDKGINTKERRAEIDQEFNEAWNHHQKRNKHHWQYWVLIEDDQTNLIALAMPDRYRKEMIADWRGAGRAQGKSRAETLPWYLEHRDVMVLHEDTRAWVEEELGHEYRIDYK